MDDDALGAALAALPAKDLKALAGEMGVTVAARAKAVQVAEAVLAADRAKAAAWLRQRERQYDKWPLAKLREECQRRHVALPPGKKAPKKGDLLNALQSWDTIADVLAGLPASGAALTFDAGVESHRGLRRPPGEPESQEGGVWVLGPEGRWAILALAAGPSYRESLDDVRTSLGANFLPPLADRPPEPSVLQGLRSYLVGSGDDVSELAGMTVALAVTYGDSLCAVVLGEATVRVIDQQGTARRDGKETVVGDGKLRLSCWRLRPGDCVLLAGTGLLRGFADEAALHGRVRELIHEKKLSVAEAAFELMVESNWRHGKESVSVAVCRCAPV